MSDDLSWPAQIARIRGETASRIADLEAENAAMNNLCEERFNRIAELEQQLAESLRERDIFKANATDAYAKWCEAMKGTKP